LWSRSRSGRLWEGVLSGENSILLGGEGAIGKKHAGMETHGAKRERYPEGTYRKSS